MSTSQPLCQARAPAVSSLPRACRARRHPSASRYHARVISFLGSLPRGPRVPAVRPSRHSACDASPRGPRVPSLPPILANHSATRFNAGPSCLVRVDSVCPAVSPLAIPRTTRQPAGPSCRPLLPAANESAPRVLSIANFRWKLMNWIRQLG